jgi:2-dehydro-3-deoxygluconokinase
MKSSSTTAENPSAAAPVAEVLCIGETMVLLGADESSLRESPTARIYVAGAEANVASGLAHLGTDVEWYGRVGTDPFGGRVQDFLGGRGVDVSRVAADPVRHTAVYFKEWVGGTSEVYYYRAHSAASQMQPSDVDTLALESRRLCHVSGITPALSAMCDNFMERLLFEVDRGEMTVSFDVNYRPALWEVEQAAPRILELARASDIVIVGRDEAETLWGTTTAQDVRALLPAVKQLIVKDADIGATCFSGDEIVFVPALSAVVVEPIGAGDAFAAGYLNGWLNGLDVKHCLRLGHAMAAHTLQHLGDNPILPPRAEIVRMATLSDDEWSGIHLPRPGADTHAASTKGSSSVHAH